MKHVPLSVGWQIAGRRALVVGGGKIALQRVLGLLASGARVTVVAPAVRTRIARLAERGKLELSTRAARLEDLEAADLVVVAIDDATSSQALAERARALRIPVHVADRAELCDFVFPAVHRDGPLTIAVSTAGAAPALASRLRDHLRNAIPPRAGRALRRFQRVRSAIRRVDPGPDGTRRMAWLTRLAHRTPWARVAAWDEDDVVQLAGQYLRSGEVDDDSETPRGSSGWRPDRPDALPSVSLVGAGPGDPELLTLRARRALRQADLVLADRLVPAPILALVEGELFVARKTFGRSRTAQAELEQRMLDAARAGRRVVRLKIGDPSLFGRMGEEVRLLRRAGLDVEVVPGVSSVQATASSIGMSLTLRGVADRLWIGTGRTQRGAQHELPTYASGTTFAFLMAVRDVDVLLTNLKEQGFPGSLPAALVCDASLPTERSVVSTLDELAAAARDAGLEPPGVLYLGDVVLEATKAPVLSDLLLPSEVCA